MTSTRRLLSVLLALGAAAGAPAHAQRIGGPTVPGSSNQFPFGSPVGGNPGTRYQQVYASQQFTPGLITGVRFFRSALNLGTGKITDARYLLSLSTTRKAVNGLNVTDLSDNLGADNRQVLDLRTDGLHVPFGGELTFTFTTPFAYDPTAGNLLFDMRLLDIGARGDVFFDRPSTFGTISSRAHDFGLGFESSGNITEFLRAPTTTVPEPSTYAMLTAGVVALVTIRRAHGRRRPSR